MTEGDRLWITRSWIIRNSRSPKIEAKAAVEAAIPSLTTLHLDPSRYKAGVDALDDKYRVGFVDKDAVIGSALGNPGKRPVIQVTLDPRTLKVISVGPMR